MPGVFLIFSKINTGIMFTDIFSYRLDINIIELNKKYIKPCSPGTRAGHTGG